MFRLLPVLLLLTHLHCVPPHPALIDKHLYTHWLSHLFIELCHPHYIYYYSQILHSHKWSGTLMFTLLSNLLSSSLTPSHLLTPFLLCSCHYLTLHCAQCRSHCTPRPLSCIAFCRFLADLFLHHLLSHKLCPEVTLLSISLFLFTFPPSLLLPFSCFSFPLLSFSLYRLDLLKLQRTCSRPLHSGVYCTGLRLGYLILGFIEPQSQ